MVGQQNKRICYCKDCGRLDYADMKCEKCGSTNIVSASQDFLLGYGKHLQLMEYVYEQHFGQDNVTGIV